jgi:hypothetical protein
MMELSDLFVFQLVVSASLFGLIWTVQVVVYPGFVRVCPEQFHEAHDEHSRRISLVVGPLMILELFLAFWILLAAGPSVLAVTGLLSVILIWGSTIVISVPIHNQLAAVSNQAARLELIDRLVWTNWIRTSLWSLRVVLSTLMVLHAFAS